MSAKLLASFPAVEPKTRVFFKESKEIIEKVLNYWLGAFSLSFHPYHFHLPGSTFFVSHRLLSCPNRSLFSTDALDVVTILTRHCSSHGPCHHQPTVHYVKPPRALCAHFIWTNSCQDTCINISHHYEEKDNEHLIKVRHTKSDALDITRAQRC